MKYYNGVFPKEALAAAVVEKDRIIPELLKNLEYAVVNIRAIRDDDGEFDNYMGYLYAMFLLAQFGEKRAFQHIIRFFTALEDDDYVFSGDFITEDLARVLASTFDGDTVALRMMTGNPRLDDFIRTAAAHALVILYFCGDIHRETLVEIFRSLLINETVQKCPYVLTEIVYLASKTYLSELLTLIQSLYGADKVDEYEWSLSDVQKDFSRSEKTTTACLRNDFHYKKITDTIKELESWSCFHNDDGSFRGTPLESKNAEREDPGASWIGTETYRRTAPKIGRNEPCPCGSGKKYKKCCGA